MIRLILTTALVGGLLLHVFGPESARRKGGARRAHTKPRKARPKRVRHAAVSR